MHKHLAAHNATLFGFLFILVAIIVYFHPSFVAVVDSAVHTIVMPFESGVWLRFFLGVTELGSILGTIIGLVGVILIFRHRPDIITRLTVALLGVTASGEELKMLIARARPDVLPGLTRITSYSFPSGHSYSSMVLYGYIALLLYTHAAWPWERKVALLVPGFIILLVGFSRIVLDYHYFTDVIGGFLLGAFWVALTLAIPLHERFYHWNTNRTEPIDRPVL